MPIERKSVPVKSCTTSQSRKPPARLVAALVLSAAMSLAGLAGAARADVPPANPGDVAKMELALPDKAPATPKAKRAVLVYGNANEFVHSSIGLGEETIVKLGEKTGAYTAAIDNDPAAFDKLKDYDAVVLVSTTGHFLIPRSGDKSAYRAAEKQRLQNLMDFVQKDGKGLVGIHAATDAYKDVPEYGELIGGTFTGHRWHHVAYKILDPESPLTAMFKGKDFVIDDETYFFTENKKNPRGQGYSAGNVHELINVDIEKSGVNADQGRGDHDNPISWIRADGKGRVFYCSHGHSESVYWNPVMLEHYLAGIQFALGDLPADTTPGK